MDKTKDRFEQAIEYYTIRLASEARKCLNEALDRGVAPTLGERMLMMGFLRQSLKELSNVRSVWDRFMPSQEAVARFLNVYYPDKYKKYMDEFSPYGSQKC